MNKNSTFAPAKNKQWLAVVTSLWPSFAPPKAPCVAGRALPVAPIVAVLLASRPTSSCGASSRVATTSAALTESAAPAVRVAVKPPNSMPKVNFQKHHGSPRSRWTICFNETPCSGKARTQAPHVQAQGSGQEASVQATREDVLAQMGQPRSASGSLQATKSEGARHVRSGSVLQRWRYVEFRPDKRRNSRTDSRRSRQQQPKCPEHQQVAVQQARSDLGQRGALLKMTTPDATHNAIRHHRRQWLYWERARRRYGRRLQGPAPSPLPQGFSLTPIHTRSGLDDSRVTAA